MREIELMLADLDAQGFAVLRQAMPETEIQSIRSTVLGQLSLMGQTRPIPHSYHLAGFHRFAAFDALQDSIARNPRIQTFLTAALGKDHQAIGLTDITVNRSQAWHTDLLRGPYAHFLAECDPWAKEAPPCLKVLVYLQPGKSLRVLAGSHRQPSPLDDCSIAARIDLGAVTQLTLAAGDVVLLDLRTVHRGSTDAEMADPALARTPKVLVSTVFGSRSSPVARAMQLGNQQRMADWDRKFLPQAQA